MTLSLLDFILVFLRKWKWIARVATVVAAGFGIVILVSPRRYTVDAVIVPQSGSLSASRLSGIATQLGIGAPATDPASSPELYADLLRSRTLLRRLVETTFWYGGRSIDLVAYYKLDQLSPRAAARDEAVSRTLYDLSVSTSLRTPVVRIAFTSESDSLSLLVVERMLALLNESNIERRTSQAAAEREYLGERVAEARRSLDQSESALESFLTRNRSTGADPSLQAQADRLKREVMARQDLLTQLQARLDQARLDELRGTPVIVTVEAPALPGQPDRRRLVLRTAIVFAVMSFAMALFVLAAALLSGSRHQEPEKWAELKSLVPFARFVRSDR